MRALVPIAHGSEDIETVVIIDVLRRASVQVVVASVEQTLTVIAARKTSINADVLLSDVTGQEWDLVVVPGGMPGAKTLGECKEVVETLKKQKQSGKWYAAICAAPAVSLYPNGLLDGHQATCYPSFADKLGEGMHRSESVVVSGKCITSQSPGTAIQFSLTLVEALCGVETAVAVAEGMLVSYRAAL